MVEGILIVGHPVALKPIYSGLKCHDSDKCPSEGLTNTWVGLEGWAIKHGSHGMAHWARIHPIILIKHKANHHFHYNSLLDILSISLR